MKRGAVVALLVAVSLGASVSAALASPRSTRGELHGDTYVTVTHLGPSSFQGAGPYAVGEYSVPLSVTDAHGVTYTTTLEVWYPAVRHAGARTSYDLATWVPAKLQFLLKSAHARALVARARYVEDAQASIPVAHGVFPLVLFSHGYAGTRDGSSYLTTHLASWGFVVAAPDHVTRDFTTVVGDEIHVAPVSTDPNGDVADLLAAEDVLGTTGAGLVAGHVDPTHVVIVGHSAGAVTAEKLAAYESVMQPSSSFLKGWVALAGSTLNQTTTAPYDTIPTIPGVMVAADHDHVVPLWFMKESYSLLGPARRFVELRGAGHQVFTDSCAIDAGHGAAVPVADALGAPLSSSEAALSYDGCFTSSGARTNVAAQWRIVDQVVVASARLFLGFDTSTAGLDGLQTAYPSLVAVDTTGAP